MTDQQSTQTQTTTSPTEADTRAARPLQTALGDTSLRLCEALAVLSLALDSGEPLSVELASAAHTLVARAKDLVDGGYTEVLRIAGAVGQTPAVARCS